MKPNSQNRQDLSCGTALICDQNNLIREKEWINEVLLECSAGLAAVRTRQELAAAVRATLLRFNLTRGFGLRRINPDQKTMSTYVYDLGDNNVSAADRTGLTQGQFPVYDGLQDRVLDSAIPLQINIDAEIRRGISSQYLLLWKSIGLTTMVGIPLRNGHITLGMLWLGIEQPNNLSLLQAIGSQISVAMSNVLAMEEITEREREQTFLLGFSNEVAGVRTQEDLKNAVFKVLGRIPNVRPAMVDLIAAIANIQANEKILAYKNMLETENSQLKEQIKRSYNFDEIVGSGPEMQQVYDLINRVSESNSTVLITGETGTGKELIARAIHNTSPRKNKLMIKVNCAALPANLIESELFGHEKGAFTGALERRMGKFELADNSTLFLDEIGEMPLEAQVKLLRVLQEKELERIGGKTPVKVNVRIIAATNRNLEEEVKAGRFRSDLYYRLNVFPIHLPPLRERRDDIIPLANFFVDRYSRITGRHVRKISPKVLHELTSYPWPGNVRELEHLIERSVLLSSEPVIREVYLPNKNTGLETLPVATTGTLADVERFHIIETIKRCRGKLAGRGGAAEYLGMPATTLHSKIKKLGITKRQYLTE